MKTHLTTGLLIAALAPVWLPTAAAAEDLVPSGTVYDKARGELSPGTAAPSRDRMVNAIKSASPTALYAMLEYGQSVECFECMPLLEAKLLSSDNAQVREISAWWLRQRAFGFGPVMVHMQRVIAEDKSAVMRARAAQALGEFLDPHALAALAGAAAHDADTTVRLAAVRALGRLNAVGGNDALRGAMSDADALVRAAALEQVSRVNFFRDAGAIIARLADDAATVRRLAVQIAGELRLGDADGPIMGLLMTDDDAAVRQAAAIALGKIGGGDAFDALADAKAHEKDEGVQDAIDIAQRMR
jgi:HEAT repeat protein